MLDVTLSQLHLSSGKNSVQCVLNKASEVVSVAYHKQVNYVGKQPSASSGNESYIKGQQPLQCACITSFNPSQFESAERMAIVGNLCIKN